MSSGVTFQQVTVAEIADEVSDVISLRLERANGQPMQLFEPGSHVELQIPNGARRSYSICSNPADLSHYTLGILREGTGRGGSAYLHESIEAGDTLLMSEPKQTFALAPDVERHVFIAGGIGVTPFISMLHRLRQTNGEFELHYLARGRGSAAFIDQIERLAGRCLKTYWSSEGNRFETDRLGTLLTSPGVQAYCCGPKRLMDSVLDAAIPLKVTVRFESFAEAPSKGIYAGAPFEAKIASSGKILAVSDTQTLLEALNENGHEVPSSCEHGICGTCLVKYIGGTPLHRDGVLNDETRKSMIATCISRAKDRLVLDL